MGPNISSSGLSYDETYQETATLRDGTRILLRTIRPSDKELLRRGFERMSPQSRYFRFFSGKQNLSEKELSYLSEIDGINHVAIVAMMTKDNGDQEGLGVARFVRLDEEPEVAEPAIAVVDNIHGRGLGTILLQRLSAAAIERGIQRFRCEVLANNVRMKRILEEVSQEMFFSQTSYGVIVVDLPVSETIHRELGTRNPHKSAIQKLLSHVALETVSVRLGKSLLKHLNDRQH
ncbi:MAG: GNAT family N-acetyltransferase [Pseudomonadota bacterium]